jgi:hypothetical protein
MSLMSADGREPVSAPYLRGELFILTPHPEPAKTGSCPVAVG